MSGKSSTALESSGKSDSLALDELKRRLAETLARSHLDYTDEVMCLTAFLTDFRWKDEAVNAEEIRRQWKRGIHSGPSLKKHRLALDLTFPYCPDKCTFCLLGTSAAGAGQIDRYAKNLQEEAAFFAPAFSGARFHSFFAGRGTPSLLSGPQLETLMGGIFKLYQFEEGAFRSIECNPATVDSDKLNTLRRIGFNHISFGVETLTPQVLRSIRREYQAFSMIQNAVRWSREAGFRSLNLDLVLGFHGDSPESFLENFRQVADLRPDSITVCGLTLTDPYQKIMNIGRQEHLRHMEFMISSTLENLRRIADNGGFIAERLAPDRGIWSFVSKEADPSILERRSRNAGNRGPDSLFCLGRLGRSHLFNRALYLRNSDAFLAEAPVYQISRLNPKEEMAHYILRALNDSSRVEYSEFHDRFDRELRDAFPLELRVLKAFGKVRLGQDSLLFLPKRTPERIFYGSIFLLDTLRKSPFSNGRLQGAVLGRLRKQLDHEPI